MNIPSAPTVSAVAGAITGLVLWILQEYLFKGSAVPEAVEGAVLILIPAALSWLASTLTRRAAGPQPVAPPPPAPAHVQAVAVHAPGGGDVGGAAPTTPTPTATPPAPPLAVAPEDRP